MKELAESAPGHAVDDADDRSLRELMIEYQAGNARAADALVCRISPMLLRFMGSRAWSRHQAEDLLQECWLRIHRSRHTYSPDLPVRPWIFAIARHTYLDGYRRHCRRDAQVGPLEAAEEIAAPDVGTADGDVARLLSHLPESQREVLWMLKVSGMTLEEVARATSSTIGAVKQKAHRAYEKLRRVLGDDPKR